MTKGFDGNLESEKDQSSVDKRGPTLVGQKVMANKLGECFVINVYYSTYAYLHWSSFSIAIQQFIKETTKPLLTFLKK